jgi:deazaflavin-dependent oxidoreductase (nitroreductase family)
MFNQVSISVASAWAARLLRTRWIVRAPVWLYRARLGFVFGSRLLMLEHTGRATGARRYTVLEVVSRPRPAAYVIASGFGSRAQWFRNVRVDPNVRVYVGGRRPVPARARLLTSEETSSALAAYAVGHPRAWAMLKPVFETTLGARIDNGGTTLPMIALDVANGSG